MKKLLLKLFTRDELFAYTFTEYEQTAILNALWRRSKSVTNDPADRVIKDTCKRLAMKITEGSLNDRLK